ncbi:MAG TPA: hypothetical protein VJT73_19865 [Polyangiaceae bacterium]|nr:hypothetical protein [Polyangiaceae bacterium]
MIPGTKSVQGSGASLMIYAKGQLGMQIPAALARGILKVTIE